MRINANLILPTSHVGIKMDAHSPSYSPHNPVRVYNRWRGWMNTATSNWMVNGGLVNGKMRTFYSFWIKMQTRTAHYQFSVFNFQLNWPAHYQFSVISYPLSVCSFKFAPFASAAGARSPPTPSAVRCIRQQRSEWWLSQWWMVKTRTFYSFFDAVVGLIDQQPNLAVLQSIAEMTPTGL